MFYLRYQNHILGVLDIKGNNSFISKGLFYADNSRFLPLPLQYLINNKDKYFKAKSTESEWILNHDGCEKVNNWLKDREIPLDRDNLNAYLSENSARNWMLNNRAFSFSDNYWLCDVQNIISYSEHLKDFENIDSFEFINNNFTQYGKENCTLGGKLEKFWFRSDGDIYLSKKNSPNLDILSIREVIASDIYEKQGIPAVNYSFIRNSEGNICGTVCKLFTSSSLELITAYDILSINNETQVDDIYEKIILRASELGVEPKVVCDYMDAQTIVDYLITNRDRHQGNIGFLRDSSSLKLVSPAPIFDSGSSVYFENVLPLSVDNTTVNGLYKTERECLSHVKNWKVIDMNKLPTVDEFKSYLNLSSELNEFRKQKMISLYTEKLSYLKECQRTYCNNLKKNNMKDAFLRD